MNDRHTLATTRPIRIFRLLPALILMSVPMAGATQTANAVDNAPSMFSLYLENDLFSGSDRYYTNGIKLSWISPDLAHFSDHASVPNWLGRLAERAPFFSDEDNRRNVTFSIGQNIYTPEDTETQELIEESTLRRHHLSGVGIAQQDPDLVRVVKPYSGYGGALFLC